MSTRDEHQKVQQAIDSALSGLNAEPFLAQRVIASAKGGTNMKRRFPVLALIGTILVLAAAAAVASGLGLFGRLARDENSDPRLAHMDIASTQVDSAITTPSGSTITIDQAYYEGNRIFISYTLTGKVSGCEFHEGTPSGIAEWQREYPGSIYMDVFSADTPEFTTISEYLDGKCPRWVKRTVLDMHDGLFLSDGTYLEIIDGAEVIQDDGSVIGWKECIVPDYSSADVLEVSAKLFHSLHIYFQDCKTLRYAHVRLDEDDISLSFSVTRSTSLQHFTGEFANAEYSAQAQATSGQIDARVSVSIICPDEWLSADGWSDSADHIEQWQLYINGAPSDGCDISWEGYGTKNLSIEYVCKLPGEIGEITLIPQYSKSGLHYSEAIILYPANIDT